MKNLKLQPRETDSVSIKRTGGAVGAKDSTEEEEETLEDVEDSTVGLVNLEAIVEGVVSVGVDQTRAVLILSLPVKVTGHAQTPRVATTISLGVPNATAVKLLALVKVFPSLMVEVASVEAVEVSVPPEVRVADSAATGVVVDLLETGEDGVSGVVEVGLDRLVLQSTLVPRAQVKIRK